jgi:hypothetical protein
VTRAERWLLWGSSAAVAASGLGFAWTKYLLKTDDPFAVVNHPWQPFFLKMHVLTAPFLVFAVGFVFSRHVVRQWQAPQTGGRRSGLGIVTVLAPMILSGYLIQTVTGEGLLGFLVAVHLATGIVYVVMVPFHRVRGLSRARQGAVAAGARIERSESA